MEVLRAVLPKSCDEVSTLRQIAKETACELVHILTIDGMGREWLRHARPWGNSEIPVVGTYYLFNNLYTAPNDLAWWWLLKCRHIDRIFISDEYWSERKVHALIRRQTSFLPDPYDPVEFEAMSQYEARAKSKLPSTGLVFLVFGDLSKRKGVAEVISAFRKAKLPAGTCLVLAGKVPGGDLDELSRLADSVSGGDRKVILRDEYIPEFQVSAYFHASDFVICNYQPNFLVSSGTSTRACAAKRPLLTVSHGVVGRAVKERSLGIVYASVGGSGLCQALEKAGEQRYKSVYGIWQKNAESVAAERTLSQYGELLLAGYQQALGYRI